MEILSHTKSEIEREGTNEVAMMTSRREATKARTIGSMDQGRATKDTTSQGVATTSINR